MVWISVRHLSTAIVLVSSVILSSAIVTMYGVILLWGKTEEKVDSRKNIWNDKKDVENLKLRIDNNL